MKRQGIVLGIVAAMVIVLAGCGGQKFTVEEQDADTKQQSEGAECFNSAANKFVRSMKIGWNLGNTFDVSSDQNKEDEMAYKSDWCGIVTTKEMIDKIKEAGFQFYVSGVGRRHDEGLVSIFCTVRGRNIIAKSQA